MATVTEIDREVAHFVTHEPRSKFSSVLREVALLHGEGKVTPGAVVREVAYLSDNVYPSAYSLLHEVAYLKDAVYPSVHREVDVREVAYLSDRIGSQNAIIVTLRDSAVILGRAVAAPTATLREVAQLGDDIFWQGGPASLREVAYLSDAAYPSHSSKLREVAYLSDDISSVHQQIVVLREIAYLSDAVDLQVRSNDNLREVAVLRGWATPRVVWGAGANNRDSVLHEIFYGDDRAIPPPSGRAFTCHIINWGMSEYANYPFLTQAKNFAAGQNLWRLDATQDYNKPVVAWITTGQLDLGVAAGKRPAAIYAAGSSYEPLIVTVTGDVDGQLASFNYVLELRDQRDYRNNKAILGKGFRSRYLQFKLLAPKYLGTRLLTAEVDLAASQRRVG